MFKWVRKLFRRKPKPRTAVDHLAALTAKQIGWRARLGPVRRLINHAAEYANDAEVRYAASVNPQWARSQFIAELRSWIDDEYGLVWATLLQLLVPVVVNILLRLITKE